jgi:hypothetical protein
MAAGSTVPAMMSTRSLPSRLAAPPAPDARHPAPGPVVSEIGLLLAAHLGLALAVCLVLDLWR